MNETTETPTERFDRLTRWARAYRRLTANGIDTQVHTAGIDAFADGDGRHPYLDVADVEWLLGRIHSD